MRAADVMTSDVKTVTPDNSVQHAARLMLDHRISGLPVVDDAGQLVGIITEGDLLRRSEFGVGAIVSSAPAQDFLRSHSWRVGDLMTEEVCVAEENTAIGDVARLMEERGVKRLPVLRRGRLVGIVSRADLLRVIACARPDVTAMGDDAIRRSILARFNEVEELAARAPGVRVAGGCVQLCGTVQSEAARRAARMIVETMQGVSGIEDRLDVKSSEAPS